MVEIVRPGDPRYIEPTPEETYQYNRLAGVFCNIPPGAVHENGTTSCADDWNAEHPDDLISLDEWMEAQESWEIVGLDE